jgi:hypothetical protein
VTLRLIQPKVKRKSTAVRGTLSRVVRSEKMMGLAKMVWSEQQSDRNNSRNLPAPPTVGRSVLLIGMANKP